MCTVCFAELSVGATLVFFIIPQNIEGQNAHLTHVMADICGAFDQEHARLQTLFDVNESTLVTVAH